jgi:hypothetical protein
LLGLAFHCLARQSAARFDRLQAQAPVGRYRGVSADSAKQQIAYDDVDAVLATARDAVQYPILASVLAGHQGEELRHELVRLVARHLHPRAPRRYLRVIGRLQGASYDEPVLLTDISATGVRFLVISNVPLDVTHFGSMRLQVNSKAGRRTLAVALVRRIGGDERHTDVACRFLNPDADYQTLVAELRSTIFGVADAGAES